MYDGIFINVSDFNLYLLTAKRFAENVEQTGYIGNVCANQR